MKATTTAQTALFVVLAAIALASQAADDATLTVVSQQDLAGYWVPVGSELMRLELGRHESGFVSPRLRAKRAERVQFGCAAYGFMIETDGTVKQAPSLLFARLDKPLHESAAEAVAVLRGLPPTFGPYRPAAGRSPKAVFTSYAVPVFFTSPGPAGTPGADQGEGLARACRIDSLGAWVTAHQLGEPTISELPADVVH